MALRPAVVALMIAASGTASAQPAATGAAFSAAQRAEIIAIVRNALRSDPSLLSDAIQALQQQEDKQQADQGAAAVAENRGAIFEDTTDPTLGNPSGRITLVEFFDVRCPYCRRMQGAVESLVARNRDVRIVMKDVPILGPDSVLGAKALLAAQRQGGYGKLQHLLMQEGSIVDLTSIRRAAIKCGLNWKDLQTEMSDRRIATKIQDNLRLAALLDINGTPAIVFGDQLVPGAMSYADLQKVVDALRRS